MDTRAVLAAYNAQIRRQSGTAAGVEHDIGVVRTFGDGWAGVTWSDLVAADADTVITAQIQRFAELPHSWEWKHYSYDRPADLPGRLVAAGFTPEPPETLLIAEITDLRLDVGPPTGVELQPVVDAAGVDAFVTMHDEVFGGDQTAIGRALLAGVSRQPSTAAGVVAFAGPEPIAAGRVEFHLGTDFASLWGGGTAKPWRGRGVFRALVAYRAALAADRGFRYLQVDAWAASSPILQRLGFVELAVTTPYVYSPITV